jgi:hypothetical protein
VTAGPPLPFPHVFGWRWWDSEITGDLALGGLEARPHGYNGLWSVPGQIYGHYCGTPDQFMNGYNPDTDPPTPRGPGIIPPCCPQALGQRVGVALYPSHTLTYGPNYPPTGGQRIGGLVLDQVGVLRPPSGGQRIGGLVLDQVGVLRPPSGGQRIGGLVLDQVGPARPPSGGVRIRGFVLDLVGPARPPSGGVRIGGFVLDLVGPARPPSGGVAVGGAGPRAPVSAPSPTGGLAVGGAGPRAPVSAPSPTGGLAVGGAGPRAPVSAPSPAGGLAVGGAGPRASVPSLRPGGGVAVGGTVAYSVGPVGPNPGPTCATAYAATTGTLYSYTGPTGSVSQWWVWAVSNGTHSITFTGISGIGTNTGTYYTGSSCSALGGGTLLFSSPATVTVTNGVLYIQVQNSFGGPTPYTLKVI